MTEVAEPGFNFLFDRLPSNSWNLEDSFINSAVLTDTTCGLAAKMAFTQYINCDTLRPVAAECRPAQETLAAEAPSVAATNPGVTIGPSSPTLTAKHFNAGGGARRADEVASCSYDPVEVSRDT